MRLLYYYGLSALELIFLCQPVNAITPTGGNQTDAAALTSSSSVSARLDTTAFVASERGTPRTAARDQKVDERAYELKLPLVSELFDWAIMSLEGHVHPRALPLADDAAMHVIEGPVVIRGKIVKWREFEQLMCRELQSQQDGWNYRDAVEFLTKPVLRDGQQEPRVDLVDLVHFFHFFRSADGMEKHADSMQRILAARYPAETLVTMMRLWIRSKLSPEVVYGILPAGLEEKLMEGRPSELRRSVFREARDSMDCYIALYRKYGNPAYSVDAEKKLMKFYRDLPVSTRRNSDGLPESSRKASDTSATTSSALLGRDPRERS
ncbi:unnamed protein product [Hyaloperonospora brassicae]|uniref:RxLR effector candidate protein n=1 Tax=Hyaloperonospora brassicae TaxID=162125 RepID=A0AAV0UED4_HYABA|nr:unnamed protein product [Hyaloperonospora brassicae]